MSENNDNKYIQETIVSKRKRKWLKRLGTLVFVVICALVFGVVARIAFAVSGDTINKMLGIDTANRQDVVINTNKTPTAEPVITPKATNTPMVTTATPVPTATPTAVPTSAVTPEPTRVVDNVPTVEISATPTIEPEIIPSLTPIPTEEPDEKTEQPDVKDENSNSINDFYAKMLDVAEDVSNVVVRIDKTITKLDWFGEKNQYHDTTSGLMLANDGIDILILVDYLTVKDGEHFDVEILDKTVSATLYSINSDFGLAVLAVEMSKFTSEELEEVQYATISSADDLYLGMPLIAYGKINGYDNSMDFGMVTSLGSTVAVPDGQVKYYTTSWTENTAASGFTFDTDGFVSGMITHTYRKSGDTMICCVTLDEVKAVIEKLLNNSRTMTSGITGTDIPKSVSNVTGIEKGIYVTSTSANSAGYEIGLVSGDMITEINDIEISGIDDLYSFVLASKPGDQIKIKFARYNTEGIKYYVKSALLNAK